MPLRGVRKTRRNYKKKSIKQKRRKPTRKTKKNIKKRRKGRRKIGGKHWYRKKLKNKGPIIRLQNNKLIFFTKNNGGRFDLAKDYLGLLRQVQELQTARKNQSQITDYKINMVKMNFFHLYDEMKWENENNPDSYWGHIKSFPTFFGIELPNEKGEEKYKYDGIYLVTKEGEDLKIKKMVTQDLKNKTIHPHKNVTFYYFSEEEKNNHYSFEPNKNKGITEEDLLEEEENDYVTKSLPENVLKEIDLKDIENMILPIIEYQKNPNISPK